MDPQCIDRLLAGPSYVAYRTRVDLLDEASDSPEVLTAKRVMAEDPQVAALIASSSEWFPKVCSRHDDAALSHYRLRMLADFGFDMEDDRIAAVAGRALSHSDCGLLAIRQALPEKGRQPKTDDSFDEWHALPCDAALLAATLYRLGCREKNLLSAIRIILERWTKPAGWFCHLFFVESQFRREGLPCMMAALHALELVSELPEADLLGRERIVKHAFAALEVHRKRGKSLYYFGRGRKFHSLKYPFVWYNALYLAEIVSRFEEFGSEPLLQELVGWIHDTRGNDGLWTPSSMFMAYRGWEFADKKNPSPWITFLCLRILGRLNLR